MLIQGCHLSSHHASCGFGKAFSNGGQQRCTCCRARTLPLLPRAEHQNSEETCSQEEAAYMKRLLGDSARRLPKQLSAKAQKQLQQLRLERKGPLEVQRSPASNGADGQIAKSATPLPHSSDKHAAEPSGADSAAVERLPTKAELRGTLGTVNRKVYEQVTQSRNRLSVRLSAANKQIRQLQKAAEGHQQEVAAMYDCITQVMTELETLGRAADAAAASMQFGTERKDSVAKMSDLVTKMQALQQVVQTHAGQLDKMKQRQIPVVWFGIAQEVRLMGSFDNWTRGFSLSAEEFSDGTFTKFQGTLGLVPGQYEVKFLVDGQWRTAPDWPTVHTQHGANNVLHVE
ncbi:hypothetical protein ABBQ38_002696 [Trebouxia sp. C0009 RCD-2024]